MRRPAQLLLLAGSFCSTAFALQQTETLILHRNTPVSGDQLGFAVALVGGQALVGAQSAAGSRGRAYWFDTATGDQLASFSADDASFGDHFGAAVDFEGGVALIGAPGDDDGVSNAGAAYLIDLATGTQLAKLTTPAPTEDQELGRSVALTATLALVGAPGRLTNNGIVEGAVYVFDRATGGVLGILEDGGLFANFGRSVAIEGDQILVGAPHSSGGGKIYRYSATNFALQAVWLSSLPQPGAQFGYSLDVDGGQAIVGSPSHGTLDGLAEVFDVSSGGVQHVLASDAIDVPHHRRFGWDVAIRGGAFCVSESLLPTFHTEPGFVYLYDATTGAPQDHLRPSSGDSGDEFGYSIDTDGQLVLAGSIDAMINGTLSGAAYLFRAETIGTRYCVSSANSTGEAATIRAYGTTSLADDDLRVVASPLPDQPYLFYFGTAQQQVPFGNGTRCVGGNTTRLNPPAFASGHFAERDVDLTAAGITLPGALHFQCWFRDPAGGGAGFDLSDGLTIGWQP